MKALGSWLVVALLAGCASSATTRMHSLLPPPAPGGSTATSAAAGGWEIAPVQLPAQVDRPQWVLRLADDSLQVLEHERWIAPLADEVRAAVAARLPSSGAPLRITLDVQRWATPLGADPYGMTVDSKDRPWLASWLASRTARSWRTCRAAT